MRHRRRLLCLLIILFVFTDLLPVYAVNSKPAGEACPPTLAKAALLMDAASGRVLYEVNAHQQMPPASVTKIMTALLVVERGGLAQKIEISQTAAGTPESSIWLEAGEKLTREQLLYACMLNSANDAAVALAESTAGSEKAFVKLMNQRALQLGMKDTHFANPHGLENDSHFTTAYDLALVSREAMKHPEFCRVVATTTKNIPWAGHDYDRLLINQNRLLYRYDDAIGIKTGYTKQAGNCVVGAAQRGNMTLIAVALNSPSVYQDLEQMFEYGFNNYSQQTIKKSQELSAEVPVADGMEMSVMARPKVDLIVAATAQERAQLSYKMLPLDQVEAPVKKGQTVGVCKLYAAGEEAGQVDLVATAAVAAKPSLLARILAGSINVLKFAGKILLIMVGCVLSIRFINLRRRKRR